MACTPTHAATVTFAASGVTTLTVRSPELNNTEPTNVHIIVHRTRSGNIYAYRRGPVLKKLELRFRGLGKDSYALFQTFLSDSAAKTVTYTDHFGFARTGFITNVDDPAEQAREKGFTIGVTFEVS